MVNGNAIIILIEKKELYKKLETALAGRFQLDDLHVGRHTIRNEKRWRENEIAIDFISLVTFDLFGRGTGGMISIKYEPTEFRTHINPEKVVNGIFAHDEYGNIILFYKEETTDTRLVQIMNELDLFSANEGITLDGISYRIRLFASNIETTIEIGNPNHPSWRVWEKEIWSIAKRLSDNAQNPKLAAFFEQMY